MLPFPNHSSISTDMTRMPIAMFKFSWTVIWMDDGLTMAESKLAVSQDEIISETSFFSSLTPNSPLNWDSWALALLILTAFSHRTLMGGQGGVLQKVTF